MFVYTKNEKVIEQLKKDGIMLIKVLQDGTHVYPASPTSNYEFFNNQTDTILSDKLTF